MARQLKKTKQITGPRRMIEITRHIAGPPRRSPGTRLWMTAQQIKAQGLAKEDFTYVDTEPQTKDQTGSPADATPAQTRQPETR